MAVSVVVFRRLSLWIYVGFNWLTLIERVLAHFWKRFQDAQHELWMQYTVSELICPIGQFVSQLLQWICLMEWHLVRVQKFAQIHSQSCPFRNGRPSRGTSVRNELHRFTFVIAYRQARMQSAELISSYPVSISFEATDAHETVTLFSLVISRLLCLVFNSLSLFTVPHSFSACLARNVRGACNTCKWYARVAAWPHCCQLLAMLPCKVQTKAKPRFYACDLGNRYHY